MRVGEAGMGTTQYGVWAKRVSGASPRRAAYTKGAVRLPLMAYPLGQREIAIRITRKITMMTCHQGGRNRGVRCGESGMPGV